MKKMFMVKMAIGLIVSVGAVFMFQNCSKSNSFAADGQLKFDSTCAQDPLFDEDCYNYGDDESTVTINDNTNPLKATPTDILFVLDESCSMETIANQVRDGFNSLLGSQFPINTKMAVTYMSPALVNDDESVDFKSVYAGITSTQIRSIIPALPGHLQLVSKNSIDSFITAVPTIYNTVAKLNYTINKNEFAALYPAVNILDPKTGITVSKSDPNDIVFKYDAAYPMTDSKRNTNPNALEVQQAYAISKFSTVACDQEWFDPGAKNSANQNCLTGAVQLTNVCTGVEAGIVSLEHMLKKYKEDNKKLFRDNSNVNIVLVSDTHEAGFADETTGVTYFGTPGARKVQSTLEEIQSIIIENNPTIASIKFSGIVPLPEVGNPLLDGLNVIGNLPATATESQVGAEQLNGFSYLPFIKRSGGLAGHAANNNWSAIASQIAEDARYSGNIFIPLSGKVKRILEVTVNGKLFDLAKVILSADGRSFSMSVSDYKTTTDLKIKFKYELDVPMPR